MNFGTKKRNEPQLIIIPLVDVVLQIVIFLLLTSTFGTAGHFGELPLLAGGEAGASVAGELHVMLDSDGQVTIDGNSVAGEGIEDIFRRGAREDLQRKVVIFADRRAFHGDVVAILDKAVKNDLTRFSVAVTPLSSEAGEVQERARENSHKREKGREGS